MSLISWSRSTAGWIAGACRFIHLSSRLFRRSASRLVLLFFAAGVMCVERSPAVAPVAAETAITQESPAPQLESGKAVERELKGGETHNYELKLEAGQFVDVTIEQLGINVRGILQKPDGTIISEADSQRGARGFEMVCAIAEASGRYVLKIRSMRELAVPGKYRVSVTELRAATSQDRVRMEAQEQFDIGELARRKTDRDSWGRADEAYYSALLKWVVVGDRRREAVARDKLSYITCMRFEKRKAVEFAKGALAIYRSLADRSGEASALFSLGEAYRMRHENYLALAAYEQSLQICREIGERFTAGLALLWLARIYDELGEKRRAIDCAQQSLPLLQAAGECGYCGLALIRMGWIFDSLGERAKALAAYNQARPLFEAEKAPQPVLVAEVFYHSGLIYAAQGETAKARTAYNEALMRLRAIGAAHIESEHAIARTLISLGALAKLQGEKVQALAYYQEVLAPYQAGSGGGVEASVGRQLGEVYGLLGEWQRAIEHTRQAWQFWHDNGDRVAEAETLSDLGAIYREMGDGEQALAVYEQATQLYRVVGHREGEAKTLAYAGAALHSLDKKSQARERIQEAVKLYREMGMPNGEAFALKLLAAVHEAQGEFAPAQAAYSRALSLSRAGEDRWLEGELLAALGAHHAARKEPAKAIEIYEQALALCRRLGARSREAEALVGMGAAYAAAGQRQKALELHQQALELARKIREPAGEAKAFASLARIQRDAGELQLSRASLEAALRLIESIRANVVNQELRASYLGATREYFEAYTDLLMKMHQQNLGRMHDVEAFQSSERRRARSLLELLAEARADLRQGVNPELVAHEAKLLEQISAKSETLRALKTNQQTTGQAADLNRQLNALSLDLRQVRDQIRAANPRFAAFTEAQPLSLAEIQRQTLDPDTLLLEYALGSERSYLWAVTQTSLHGFELPKRAEIEAQARKVYGLMTARASQKKGETEAQLQARAFAADKQFSAEAAKLSRMLLGPVAAQLGNKRLLIVADGALQYLPFAALPEPETGKQGEVGTERSKNVRPVASSPRRPVPLIVNHEIINLPSASTLAVLRRELAGRASAPKSVAVLADPVFSKGDLRVTQAATRAPGDHPPTAPAARSVAQYELLRAAAESGAVEGGGDLRRLEASRKEAQAIAAIVPRELFRLALDFDASRATAMSEALGQYRIIHFATHGLVNSAHPALSGLVLSLVDEKGNARDGFLRVHEIYNLRLPADLVVLSACQTALGREVSGEGLVGLTRGFMCAGAARVLATLWKVDDQKTASLMKAFYERLLGKDGQMRMTPAAALRAAQIEMWRSKLNSPPFYWAGFVLQGEYK